MLRAFQRLCVTGYHQLQPLLLLHLYNKQNILKLTDTYPVCHLQAPHWGRHYQEDSHGGPQEIITDRRI